MRWKPVVAIACVIAPSAFAQDGWARVAFGTAPGGRQLAAMSFDPIRRELLLFGGSGGLGAIGDTWSWNGSAWQRLFPTRSPSARSGHQLVTVAHRGELMLHGGHSSTGYKSDTWVWDGVNWQERFPTRRPPPRALAAIAYDESRGRVVLVGGVDDRGLRTDTWEWDGSEWTEILAHIPPPPARASHMFFDAVGRERVVLSGNNTTTSSIVHGTWEWDGSSWLTLLAPQASPPLRSYCGLAFDRSRGRGVMFGGNSDGGAYLDDTWEWHVDRWEQRPWTVRPPGRYQHAMAYDPVRNEVIVTGGVDATSFLYDTWRYRVGITEPAGTIPLGTGCAGSGGTPTLACAEGREPWLGEDAKLLMTGLPGALFAPAFGMMGTTTGAFGGSPIPLDLVGLGAPGCTLFVAPFDAWLLPRAANGGVVWRLRVPEESALVGAEFGAQGLSFDFLANPLGVVLTNGIHATIGRR